MVKESILLVSMMAGGVGLFGLATGAIAPASKPVPAPTVITAPPVRITDAPAVVIVEEELAPAPAVTAKPRSARARKINAPKAVQSVAAEAKPCGNWNEIGAVYQNDKGANGVHRVRTLCF
jgi:hypothetical protein